MFLSRITYVGTITDRREVQSAKALLVIIVNEVGKVSSVKAQSSRYEKYIQYNPKACYAFNLTYPN